MVRKAIAPKHLQEYLQNLAKSHHCSFGLILGQPADEKDYILHLARSPVNIAEYHLKHEVTSLAHIPELAVSEHAIHTTRMLPGGLYVLGLFFVTNESVFKPLNKKIITILQQVHSRLGNNPWLYGNHANSNERLILHYAIKTHEYDAKIININTGTFNLVNLSFSEKEPQWCQLECRFDFSEVLKPIPMDNEKMTLKNQLRTITGNLNSHLKSAVFIFDGKLCDPHELLDCTNLSKRLRKVPEDITEDGRLINVVLLLPTTHRHMNEAAITENAGSIRIVGQIASAVWLNPATTYEVASRAVVEDIVRSFQSRLSMHFDSLTEGELMINDTCSLHEPPRRVQISLPFGTVSLSDYLFPGEGAHEAQISFQDVLDVPISYKYLVKDTEGQADLSGFYSDMASRDGSDIPLPSLPTDTNKFMYMVGAGVAVGVLLISLLIHFLRENNYL